NRDALHPVGDSSTSLKMRKGHYLADIEPILYQSRWQPCCCYDIFRSGLGSRRLPAATRRELAMTRMFPRWTPLALAVLIPLWLLALPAAADAQTRGGSRAAGGGGSRPAGGGGDAQGAVGTAVPRGGPGLGGYYGA